MTTTTSAAPWEARRTDETRQVEGVLRAAGFERADAYRYNSAVIRVRVIDPRFEGLRVEQRDALVDPHLARLPEEIAGDIFTLHTFAPSELAPTPKTYREYAANQEFEEAGPVL